MPGCKYKQESSVFREMKTELFSMLSSFMKTEGEDEEKGQTERDGGTGRSAYVERDQQTGDAGDRGAE